MSAELAGVTALVLAAGSSRRLGRPKQTLPFEGGTLLGATLDMVRRCGVGQVVVTLGAAADQVHKLVNLDGLTVVHNDAYGEGCSSSIAAALPAVDESAEGVLLLLGDQPMVDPADVRSLVDVARGVSVAVTRYSDGIGHPFWLGRDLFDDVANLHGDKGVWKLVDRAGSSLVESPAPGTIPLDVDTWEDYHALLDRHGTTAVSS